MAVDITKYKAAGEFDANAATDKRIVAVVTPVEGVDTVIGAGIVKKVAGGYSMTVETKQGTETVQKEYVFNASGYPANEETAEANVRLTMAETNQGPVTSNVSESNIVYTRGSTEGGKTKYTETSEENAIIIESLNAKDQFAIQILRSILDKVNNPSDLSKNEMAYYSEVAYTWAGYMMKESSEARSVIRNSTPSDSTKTEEVVYLEGNTEKLLNNIAAALDKTNAKITVGQEVDLIAERITIPELNKLIEDLKTLQENYVKDGNTTVGLKDLIAAIGNINFTNLISAITNLSTVRTANIGSNGLGNSANNPLYISNAGSGSIPEESDLSPVEFGYADSFYVFNNRGKPGYYTFTNAKNAILYGIQTTIDNRIEAWLDASKVTISGNDYNITPINPGT